MKKIRLIAPIIWAVIFFAVSFATLWWQNETFDILLIFFWVPFLMMLILFVVSTVTAIIALEKGKRLVSLIAGLIIFITLLVVFKFPFSEARLDYEFKHLTEQRQEVVDKIIDGRIDSSRPLVELPGMYRHLTSDRKTVYVYENDEDGVEIAFWVFRGMLSGSEMVVYSDGGEDLIWKNGDGHPVTLVEHLGGNWYYVETDY